jgi:all-trans-retinol 13,14-reductase
MQPDIPDYLVVGSGLAGLSFSTLMAVSGRSVEVVESHYTPGGYGHTFAYGKPPDVYRFNAQLHYVWNCGPGETVDRFLEKAGMKDEVSFERFDATGFDRMRMPGYALDIPNDWSLLASRLAALFPSHAAECAAFLEEVQAVAAEIDALPPVPRGLSALTKLPQFRRLIRYRNDTLGDVFRRFSLPPAAQTLIALQWPDFLLPPGKLSFFAWVMLFTGYMRGAYYPTKHFEHIIDGMVRRIETSGSKVRLRHRVIGFLSEGDRICGVTVEEVDDDGAATGPVHELRAKHVICNMDPKRAAEMIGLERFSRSTRKKLNYDYSPSNFMAYCVVEGIDLRDYGFGRSNLFHTEDPDLDRCFAAMMERGDYSRPSFVMTVPSLLTPDRGDCPEGKQIMELLTVADFQRFQQLKFSRPKHYQAKKREIYEAMLDVIDRDYVPGIRDHICFKMLGSPTTNTRYCASPEGNSYGSNLTPANMGAGRLNWESSVPGLSFCNASSGYGGFAGTIWTGCNLYQQLSDDVFLG